MDVKPSKLFIHEAMSVLSVCIALISTTFARVCRVCASMHENAMVRTNREARKYV